MEGVGGVWRMSNWTNVITREDDVVSIFLFNLIHTTILTYSNVRHAQVEP